jgi:hypothetical protein
VLKILIGSIILALACACSPLTAEQPINRPILAVDAAVKVPDAAVKVPDAVTIQAEPPIVNQ